MNWFSRTYKRLQARMWGPRMPEPPRPTRPPLLTRMRWRLFGRWNQPKPLAAARPPSLMTRLRLRFVGPPSVNDRPMQASRPVLPLRLVYGLVHLLPLPTMFKRPEEGEVDPRYWRTRSWLRLLLGVPALIALTASTTLTVMAVNKDKRDVAKWYVTLAQNSGKTALDLTGQKKFDEANAKLSEALTEIQEAALLNPSDTGTMLTLAEVLMRQGDLARAIAVFSSLAPDDEERPGTPAAHFHLARLLLAQSPTTRDHFSPAAERHLLRIVNQGGELGVAANALLGENYAHMGRPRQAIPYLRRTHYQSESRLLLAEALASVGNRDAAEEAKSCLEVYENRLRLNPSDIRALLSLVRCLVVMREYSSAIMACEAGIRAFPKTEKDAIEALLYKRDDIFWIWCRDLENDPFAPPAAKFDVLERALAAAPNDGRFISRLVTYIDPKSKEGARARELLQTQITNGNNLGLAHFVLGLYAFHEQKPEQARNHLDFAHKLLPNNADLSSDLAFVLANLDPPQLEMALPLIEDAVKQNPNYPYYRHNRGLVYFKLGRWKDAIVDLEFALDGGRHPNQSEIHGMLAVAYEKTGDPEMEKLHRNKIDKPGKKKEPAKR